MVEIRTMACCGLKEIHGVTFYATPERVLKELLRIGGVRGFASGMIFTGATPNKHVPESMARAFEEFIEAHNLGTVHVFPPHRNKNTGRYIFTYLWQVKPRNLAKWHRENQ